MYLYIDIGYIFGCQNNECECVAAKIGFPGGAVDDLLHHTTHCTYNTNQTHWLASLGAGGAPGQPPPRYANKRVPSTNTNGSLNSSWYGDVSSIDTWTLFWQLAVMAHFSKFKVTHYWLGTWAKEAPPPRHQIDWLSVQMAAERDAECREAAATSLYHEAAVVTWLVSVSAGADGSGFTDAP